MPARSPLEVAEAFRGVNRREGQQGISRRDLWTAQNLYAPTRGIAETRPGVARFNSSAVSGATGRNIARFYPSGGTARKIAAFNLAAGDALYYGNDAAGTLAEITGSTALSANKQWLFTEFQGAFYAGNATEAIQKTTNGTTRANIGGSPALPVGYPAGPYRSRLLVFGVSGNLKRVYYTDTFTENAPADSYIIIEDPEDIAAVHVFGRDDDQGVFGDLAIFTPTHTWVVRGDFKDIAGGYSLERVEGRLGTLSPLSLVDTPYGLMGLGYDGTTDLVAFLIPKGGGRPFVVSDRIRDIEALPRAYRNLANAAYYDGWYRLAFAPSGATTPTREWWADLRSINPAASDYGIQWWGPMTGRTIGAMAVQSGAGDTNQLIGVDGSAGYVVTLDPAETWDDYGTDYTAILETKALDGGDPLHVKTFAGMLVGAKPTATESITVRGVLDEGRSEQDASLSMPVTAPVVGDATLVSDSTLVGGANFREWLKHFSSPLIGNRMSLRLTYSGGNQFSVKRMTPLAAKTKRVRT